MGNTYGYKPLSYELITLLRSGAPDFAAAEDLIRRGADVNDQGDDKGENVLSEILMGYWQSGTDDMAQEECWNCELSRNECAACEHNLNPNVGESMIKVIRFFLNHGFDVNRNDGRHGAQALNSLTLSSFDRYMIDATKMLLDAGAKNIPVDEGSDETPMDWIGTEGSYQDTCEHDHALGNVFEAVYQIYLAQEEGRSYAGIDSYETALGKKILYIMADAPADSPVFSTVSTDRYSHDNSFSCNLFFLFDGGFLIYRRDASCYVDTLLPEKPLVDVSAHFPQVIGQSIDRVSFSHHAVVKGKTHYGQPVTTFHLSDGKTLSFTMNFGEEEREHYIAYYF